MHLTDQLCYAMLGQMDRQAAPFSVVFPAARLLLPQTQVVDIEDVMDWLRSASDRGWVELFDFDYEAQGRRLAVDADFVLIADEYRRGLRDPNEIQQITDRPDIWLEISDQGREALELAWPDMPPEAEH